MKVKCKMCSSENTEIIKGSEKYGEALSTLGLNPDLHALEQHKCHDCGQVFSVQK